MKKEFTVEEKRAYATKLAELTKQLVAKAVKNGIKIVVDVKSTKDEPTPIAGLRKVVMQNGVDV